MVRDFADWRYCRQLDVHGDHGRARRYGQVTWHRRVWDADHRGRPGETETELLVENHGLLYGRFMLKPQTPTPLTLTERLAA